MPALQVLQENKNLKIDVDVGMKISTETVNKR